MLIVFGMAALLLNIAGVTDFPSGFIAMIFLIYFMFFKD